jgi:hypothetical protein
VAKVAVQGHHLEPGEALAAELDNGAVGLACDRLFFLNNEYPFHPPFSLHFTH